MELTTDFIADASGRRPTVCAISTPAGTGGIAVARISGPDAVGIVGRVWRGRDLAAVATHTAHYGTVIDPETGDELDQAVATVFRGPRSFTGEDTVEIAVHGSRWIQRELIALLIRNGAEPASAGEFTRRAFVNGRLDLAEAEAVADMIASDSRAAHRVAMSQMRGDFSRRLASLRAQLIDLASLLELELDFSEEQVEFASRSRLLELTGEVSATIKRLGDSFAAGNAIREGVPVAIVGETNAGKSSLLNALLGEERAIVSDIRGTTRDLIDDTVEINGVSFRLTDTAGLRDTADPVETIGIDRAIDRAGRSRAIIWVVDPTSTPEAVADAWRRLQPAVEASDAAVIAAVNKADIAADAIPAAADLIRRLAPDVKVLTISALTHNGLDALRTELVDATGITAAIDSNELIVTNARHFAALRAASAALTRVDAGLRTDLSADFIAQDLREVLHHLGEITGAITTPDLLANIFAHFCIGK